MPKSKLFATNIPFSVVIPCKDDRLVVRCVDSIDIDCEVLIVFNGSSPDFMHWVKKSINRDNTRYLSVPKANLSLALETGTHGAEANMVLYMDSDCIFSPGSLAAFKETITSGNPRTEVYKGSVVFDHGRNLVERIIAQSRQHHTSEVLTAYKPPLAISKDILPAIGGYAFDKRLIWREDSDLDNRIRIANISIVAVPKGLIRHRSMTLKTDLRSTFRYGIGLAIANAKQITLTEVPRSVRSTLKSQGVLPALYMVFRNRIYDLGYIYGSTRIHFGYEF